MLDPENPPLASPIRSKELEALSQALRSLDFLARTRLAEVLGMLDQAEIHLTQARREHGNPSDHKQARIALQLNLDACRRLMKKAGEMLGVLEGK